MKLDDGQVLTEAAVIQQYIADKAPGKKLAPAAGTTGALPPAGDGSTTSPARLHKGIGQLFNPAMPDEYKEAVKKGLASKQLPVSSRRRSPAATI